MAALTAFWCTACSSSSDGGPAVITCPGPHWGLAVRVTDAATGQFIGSGATVLATSGTFSDTRTISPASPDSSWVELAAKSGTYRVTVTKAGYSDWIQDNVVVKADMDPCGYNPAEELRITAALQRVK